MCGIFGAIGHELPAAGLSRVLQALRHRGPDAQGTFVDSSARVAIAHTRLAVIDLETGDQPLESADGSIVLAANGEIYGFEHHRQSLQRKGYKFRTKSDSEVIIYLYQEYGLACFEQLRGEFAFLLYDRARRLFIAARDRFGIKPLYIARTPHGCVLASEMKALFASGLVAPKINAAAFDPFAARTPDGMQFPFEGVEHVSPASYLLMDLENGRSETRRYWSPDIPAVSAEAVSDSDADAAAHSRAVLQQLEDAVRLRLRADVPVGLYLSGGIDSSFIAALMKRNLNSSLHSFSIAFEGSKRNEQEPARRAAEFIGTEHHELTATKQMLWDNLEQCLWFSELPFVSLAPVGKFLLSREARKFVTVVLTGEGADEVFLGYRRFFANAIRDTRGRDRGAASAHARRLKMGRLAGLMGGRTSLLFFARSAREQVARGRKGCGPHHDPGKPIVNAVQEERIAAMPGDILCFLGDREEMAHSLEARLPYLDHLLYEQARSIPVDFKFRKGVEKAVLRDAAKDILPDDLRLRRKSGFMLTSEAVDFYGADRGARERLERYFDKRTFENAGVFSYRAFRLARLLAKLPRSRTFGLLQLRRNANKALMYMLQAHMLHDMFVERPRWIAATEAHPGKSMAA